MPPCCTRNSFQSSLPVVSSSCWTSTVTSSPTVVSAPALVSGTSASALISPEFLASVIQAIQTLISAIVQQSLSAAVGTPSISMQGLPTISVQGLSESSLVNRAAHLDAFGMHQPWSLTITSASQSSTAVGSLSLNASTTSTSPPVASQLNAVPGTSSFLVVPPFVSVFSSASLLFSAPCSSTVYSLPTTVNSAFASHPIVSHTAVPSLAALRLQQPLVVGPSYSPVPYKVASQINLSIWKIYWLKTFQPRSPNHNFGSTAGWFCHTRPRSLSVRFLTLHCGWRPFPFFILFFARIFHIDGEI